MQLEAKKYLYDIQQVGRRLSVRAPVIPTCDARRGGGGHEPGLSPAVERLRPEPAPRVLEPPRAVDRCMSERRDAATHVSEAERAQLDALAGLLRARDALDAEIVRTIGRPASIGNLGEFIAARIFDIHLAASGVNPGHDGYFASGAPLALTDAQIAMIAAFGATSS